MSTKTKEKTKNEQPELTDQTSGNGKTSLALIPPTSLLAPGALSEAEKAFLDEAQVNPDEKPTKLPTIAINHKGGENGEFVLPDGSTVAGEDGISGFIIAHFTTRTYYAGAFDPKAEHGPPDCKSADCITPDADSAKKQADSCASCQHNVFGTAKVGKGKACKEYIRLFLVSPAFGTPPIAMLTLPPSAIGKFYGGQMVIGGKRGYFDQLRSRHRAWQIVWTKITLHREDEDNANVVPEFEMGEVANLDVARALAAINNQFVTLIKKARTQDVPAPVEREPGEEG
jgi:hypothetical protein